MESKWDLWMLHSNNVLQCILVYSVIRGYAHKAESSKSHNRAPISSVHCARLLQFNTKFVMWRYPVKCKADETGSKCNVSVHCQEEGCTRKYIPLGPRNFPRRCVPHSCPREWIKWYMYVVYSNLHQIETILHIYFNCTTQHCTGQHINNTHVVQCTSAHWQWVSRLALTNCSEVTAELCGCYRVTSKQTESAFSWNCIVLGRICVFHPKHLASLVSIGLLFH